MLEPQKTRFLNSIESINMRIKPVSRYYKLIYNHFPKIKFESQVFLFSSLELKDDPTSFGFGAGSIEFAQSNAAMNHCPVTNVLIFFLIIMTEHQAHQMYSVTLYTISYP